MLINQLDKYMDEYKHKIYESIRNNDFLEGRRNINLLCEISSFKEHLNQCNKNIDIEDFHRFILELSRLKEFSWENIYNIFRDMCENLLGKDNFETYYELIWNCLIIKSDYFIQDNTGLHLNMITLRKLKLQQIKN